jgi:hypothetical protein
MKVRSEQFDRLTDRLMKSYQAKGLIVLKTDAARVLAKMKEILARNFREEEAIEEEARAMLATHAGEVKEMDHYKMFQLIKQKLAQKRGFIL